MPTHADIVTEARSWVGVRYQHQASVKGVACDCIGLVRGVGRACGLVDPFTTGEAARYSGYERSPNSRLLLEACAAFLNPISLAAAIPGDVLTFRFDADAQHFGILSAINPRYVIHSYAQARRVVENRIDDLWASRIVGAYHLRGVN